MSNSNSLEDNFSKKEADNGEANRKENDAQAASDTDDELDAILDDALEDFDKPTTSKASETSTSTSSTSKEIVWTEEFMKQASEEFERNIRSMMSENPCNDNAEFSENLLKISQEAAAKVLESGGNQDFSASFADTLKYLAEGTESLQAEPDEEALAKMLEKMAFGADSELGEGVEGDLGGLGELLPAMQGMLKSLLSKDLLYPSIKDIVNKYPDWLADNRSKLSAEEYEKYNRQFSLMQQVCVEFENEKENDDEQVKNSRFELILSLMQQMQECGHPPKELAGDVPNLTNPFSNLDLNDVASPRAENCTLM